MKDIVETYDAVKEFEGRKYTGMRVGGSHSWRYEQGEWEETKVTPDKWQFTYAVKKRRKWDAPIGSGAPTGTEYHWYILAHQRVRKLDANEYTTSMMGTKYKLAHRRAGNEEWSSSGRGQIKQLIAILEENIIQLRHELGESSEELAARYREMDSPAATDPRRREMLSGQKMLPNGLTLGMLGQPPLESYIPQTGTDGAGPCALPSVVSSSSSSLKSVFLPKKRR